MVILNILKRMRLKQQDDRVRRPERLFWDPQDQLSACLFSTEFRGIQQSVSQPTS